MVSGRFAFVSVNRRFGFAQFLAVLIYSNLQEDRLDQACYLKLGFTLRLYRSSEWRLVYAVVRSSDPKKSLSPRSTVKCGAEVKNAVEESRVDEGRKNIQGLNDESH